MIKTFLILAAFLAIAFSVPSEQEAKDLFNEFKAKYNRNYGSVDENNRRFIIFQKALTRIEELNAEESTAVYGITKFADMTPEEFEETMLTRKRRVPLDLPQADLTACAASTTLGQEWCTQAPAANFDWRTYGAVTGVKDQGNCGSCWSFGTTGDIEGTWFLSRGKLVSLSEQQLVSCDKTDSACNGGLQENAFNYVIKTGGIQSEADYPYVSGSGSVPACAVNTNKFVANISAWAQVSKSASGEANIASYLVANGPVTIGINANQMQYYSSGIATPTACSPLLLNHAVLIVGYGTENGVDYWLIKNSWGTSWGEQGYYRIVRGSNACGVANDVVHSLP